LKRLFKARMTYNHISVSSNFEEDDSEPRSRNWEFGWRPGRKSLAFVGVVLLIGAFTSSGVQQIHRRDVSTGKLSSIEQLAAMTSDKCKQYADITIKSINHNNLGGVGPDMGDEALVYDVSMGSESFWLSVTQVSSTKNGKTVANGMWKDKGMGKIAVMGGQKVRVRFQFFDKVTKKPKKIPKFAFTFYDLDRHAAGTEIEFVKLYTYISAVKTFDSEISHTADEVTDAGIFAGTKTGGWHDNPSDPMRLTQLQRNRAVTLTFADHSGFEADLGNTGRVANAKSHRAVLFAPKATLYCIGHLEEITREPMPTTMMTTSKPAGSETTAKMKTACKEIVTKGRTADKPSDLKKMIADSKYVKTTTSEETMYFAGTPLDLCTEFADASGSTHKVCIGAREPCTANMVWKVSGDLQFNNEKFGGETITVILPTEDTTLVETTFTYELGGFYGEPGMKLTVQGYKSAPSR